MGVSESLHREVSWDEGADNWAAPAIAIIGEGDVLTTGEQAELERHEAIIEKGLRTFVEVGDALLSIRDGRLYRERNGTFEAYCQERWGISRPRAYQLMDAAKVTANLSTIVDNLPANEAQVRPLARLEPEEQAGAWGRAVEIATETDGRKVVARHVEQAVEEMRGPVEYQERSEVFHIATGETVAREGYTLADIEAATRECLSVDISRIGVQPDSPHISSLTGRVFIVTPHARKLGNWVKVVLDGYEEHRITEAVVVVPVRTSTAWWASLRDAVVCLIEGRVEFPHGQGFSLGAAIAVFYLGPNVEAFYKAFYHLGDIWQRMEHDG
jgi:hypothetical protein